MTGTRLLRRSAALAVLMGASLPIGWAHAQTGELEEANLFVELNDTDGDIGLHALIDGEAWGWLVIRTPGWTQDLLNINARGQLHEQGLTEFAFESAEPSFDELSPEAFFERFPEGLYPILAGSFPEGPTLSGEAELTHVIPAPPEGVFVNDQPLDEDCEAGEPPEVTEPVVISWDAVETRHPELGEDPGSPDIVIVRYQLVVELETEDEEGNEVVLVYSLDVLPDAAPSFEISVPPEFLAGGEEFKYEILVREESGNQTAIESCFALAEE